MWWFGRGESLILKWLRFIRGLKPAANPGNGCAAKIGWMLRECRLELRECRLELLW